MRYFVIAELGINHMGDMKLAKQMIDAAEEAGSDAVKLQYYAWDDIADEFTGSSLGEIVKKSQLNLDQLGELRDYTRSRGLGFICTAFKRPRRIGELASLKPDGIKIRYRDYSLQFVDAALRQDPPLLLVSCPAPPIERMDIYYHPKARWLYCIPKYPPAPEDFDAAKSTGFHGFSDHYPHITASLLAASLTRGSEYIIEKHVMSDPPTEELTKRGWFRFRRAAPKSTALQYPDQAVSISFPQLKELVAHLRLMEKLRPGQLYFPQPPRVSRG